MTAKQIDLVRESFQDIRERSGAVALLFYGRLFDLDPALRALFKIDMREQSRKLMDMLTTLVDSLDQLDAIRPQLRELGQRHAGYGVLPEHYRTVAAALLWALGHALGDQSYPEMREAWAAVLGEVSQEMMMAPEPSGR